MKASDIMTSPVITVGPEAPVAREKTVHFRFPQPPRSGHRVITLKDVDHAYGDLVVYRGLNFEAERGQRTVLVDDAPTGDESAPMMEDAPPSSRISRTRRRSPRPARTDSAARSRRGAGCAPARAGWLGRRPDSS